MKNLLKSLAVLTVLAFSQSSLAGLLIEPFLGSYDMTNEVEGVSSSVPYEETSEPTGSLMGLKLGYSTFGLAAGADYTIIKDEENDITATGLFVSYKFPVLVKAYATYILSAAVDGLKAGTGTKIGVGFTGLPFVHINLEMYSLKWDDTEPGVSSGDSFESTATGSAIVISLPFDI